MQFGITVDVEDADVAVLPCDAPEMAPLTSTLQLLSARSFSRFQALDVSGIETVGDLDLHIDVEEHG